VKDISKQYALLTADERFRFFVAAMGRQDEQELDRLENSCPRKTYTGQDYAYTQRKMFFIVLSFATAVTKLRNDLACLWALVAALAMDEEDDEDSANQDKALDVFRQLMRLRDAKRNGWVGFCEQIGADPDAIVAPFLGDLVETVMRLTEAAYESLEESLGQTGADDDRITTNELNALIESWRQRIA
jgi:hypothetical protein